MHQLLVAVFNKRKLIWQPFSLYALNGFYNSVLPLPKSKKWPKLSEFLFLEFWNFIKKIRIKNIAKKNLQKKNHKLAKRYCPVESKKLMHVFVVTSKVYGIQQWEKYFSKDQM